MSAEQAAASVDLIEARLLAAFATCERRPFVVGLSGAQGSGKSTVSAALEARFTGRGLRVALLSLDDLYLPREERERLAREVHPLLATRGVPGTHEIELGEAVIAACAQGGVVELPRFSKEMDTRLPRSSWSTVGGPVDIVLFEGWCVGARPQAPEALTVPVNELEAHEDAARIWRGWVNDRLAGDYQRLFARIDMLILLAAPAFDVVPGWRKQQEHALRVALQRGERSLAHSLDDARVDRFVQHYQRLTEHILAEMPARADLCIALDAQRRPQLIREEKGGPWRRLEMPSR